MRQVRLKIGALLGAAALTGAIYVSQTPSVQAKDHKAHAKMDIVDTASKTGQFKTLLAAAKAAGLVDTLKSKGPFTVFAPTDAAFAKLPKGAVDALLKDKKKLQAVLLYHVVPGKQMASSVVKRPYLISANKKPLYISTKNGARIGNANIVKTDIKASNGVIHVIDTVLMPPTS
jgi:uncharacterized surface protein with fasciclin (FAS1) repeats